MKIKFPFTNNYIEIRKNKGGTMSNGNGRRHITYQIIIRKKVGNGDTGIYGQSISEQLSQMTLPTQFGGDR